MTRIVLAILALLGITAALGGIKFLQIKSMIDAGKTMQMPPEAVTTAEATQDAWEPLILAVGSIQPVQGVTLRAESAGVLDKIHFESGARVQAGDLIAEIERSAELAALRSAEARADLTRLNLERYRDLFQRKSVSQADLDLAEAQHKEAVAQVDGLRAQVNYKEVRAPFAGVLGIREANLGQYLKQGDALIPLQSIDPVYVNFNLPQQDLGRLAAGQSLRIKTDSFSDTVFPGQITAINAEVDASTRNIKVQGTLANAEGRLRAGMFVDVEVVMPDKLPVIRIPATSIIYAPYGNSVFVVEKKVGEDGKEGLIARQQIVRLGETRGDFVAVTEGLKAGEVVVTTGAFKLRNGVAVQVNNSLAPEASLTPKPKNS